MCKTERSQEIETDSAMGIRVLGLNIRIGGRDVMITIEEARVLERNLYEALHSPINPVMPVQPFPIYGPVTPYSPPEIEWRS